MLGSASSTHSGLPHAARWQPVPHYCRPVIWGEWVGRFCAVTPGTYPSATAGSSSSSASGTSAQSGTTVQLDRWFDLCWDYTPADTLPPAWTVEACADIDLEFSSSSSASSTASNKASSSSASQLHAQTPSQATDATGYSGYTWQRAQECGLDLSDIDPSLFDTASSSLSAAAQPDVGHSSSATLAGNSAVTTTPSSSQPAIGSLRSGGVVNRARIPTRRPGTPSRTVRHCPLDFACLQLLDDMDDAHIACVRAAEIDRLYARPKRRYGDGEQSLGRAANAAGASAATATRASASRSAAGDAAEVALTMHRGYRTGTIDQLLQHYRLADGSWPH